MSKLNDSARQSAVIGQVREASIDPVVGESVMMAVQVVSSTDRTAASAVPVLFSVRAETKTVVTDSQGWARFSHIADAPGDLEIIAKVEGISEKATHRFSFKILAAGVWDGAQFKLDDGPETVWGEEAGFPRVSRQHTVRLTPTPESQLIDREVCLGLKSYLSASALGLTITPALGVYRRLTSSGLSWTCTAGTGKGAYALQLAALRILKLSSSNTMSLGAVPEPEPEPIPEVQLDARFDQFAASFGTQTQYPCHGAVHTISVKPKSSAELSGMHVRLVWEGEPAENFGVVIRPPLPEAQLLTDGEVTWELDCRGTSRDTEFNLRVEVVELGYVSEPLAMSLGHNLVTAEHWSTAHEAWPDWTTYFIRHIRAKSKHLKSVAPGVKVLINGGPESQYTNSVGVYSRSAQSESVVLSIINRYDGSIV